MNFYDINIGLEVHIELITDTKIFCSCPNRFGDKPNTNICPLCIGIPGSMPIINKKVIEHAVKIGLALNCNVNKFSCFDRKHYFYPDLPKSYQLTQIRHPILTNGFLNIYSKDFSKKIKIKQIHIEEDAGKLTHLKDFSFIDFNRSGVPLLEIVTNPCFENADEVINFIKKLQKILIYTKVCDAKMQEGSLRVDINLSIKNKDQKKLGTRVEIKNINSFKAIKNAIKYEVNRQIKALNIGEKIQQQTRRWSEEEGKTIFMRLKSGTANYKFFNEPDLPVINLSDYFISSIKNTLPELPDQKAFRFIKDYNLDKQCAENITSSLNIADIFENINKIYYAPMEVYNLLTGELFKILTEKSLEPEDIYISPQKVATLVKLLNQNKINRTIYKQVFKQIFEKNVDPVKYIEQNNLNLIESEQEVLQDILNILDKNKKAVFDFKNGKDKALTFLIGQAMKSLKSKANPNIIHKILTEQLKR